MITHFPDRMRYCQNPTAIKLFNIMLRKQSNLSVALDVTRQEELLRLADNLGPTICVLKTHIDILEDFTPQTAIELKKLADRHDFLIFEDRKFADIGNTVALQYGKGIYHIADWSHITNAHTVPGPGIIAGLKKIGLPKGNGLLLLAEMSSQGSLATGIYTQQTLAMAQENPDFVIGFVTQHRLLEEPNFINFTPGIKFAAGGDALGQSYITPEDAILKNHTDVIIVGRGIYEHDTPIAEAKKYQKAGWEAYLALRSNN